jgi:hypothetical protein
MDVKDGVRVEETQEAWTSEGGKDVNRWKRVESLEFG